MRIWVSFTVLDECKLLICNHCTLALSFVLALISSLSISSYSFISCAYIEDIWRVSSFLSLGRILNCLQSCLIFDVYFSGLADDRVLNFMQRGL